MISNSIKDQSSYGVWGKIYRDLYRLNAVVDEQLSDTVHYPLCFLLVRRILPKASESTHSTARHWCNVGTSFCTSHMLAERRHLEIHCRHE